MSDSTQTPGASAGWAKHYRHTTLTVGKEIGVYPFRVYAVLKARADTTTGECFPTLDTIADDAGIGRSTVQKCIPTLEQVGLITVIPGRSNRYVVRDLPSGGSDDSAEVPARGNEIPPHGTDKYRQAVPNKNHDNKNQGIGRSDTAAAASDAASPPGDSQARQGSRSRSRVVRNSPEHEELARFLDTRIQENSEAEKPATEQQIRNWANEVRLMVEQDGRSLADIRSVIEWAQAHDLWHLNIRSMAKLRKQYARLWDEMRKGAGRAVNRSRPDPGGRGTDYYVRAIEAKMAAQGKQGDER